MAKILAIGAFNYPYVRDNWLTPIKALYGDNAISVDVNTLLSDHNIKWLEEYIFDLVNDHGVQLVLFYHDIIFADFKPSFFDTLRKHKVTISAFYADDEPSIWYQRNIKYDGNYDFVASHSKAGAELRAEQFPLQRSCYLPWGYSSEQFFPHFNENYKYDVVFIGKNKQSVNQQGVYIEDGKERDNLLEKLADMCDRHQWGFSIFGFGWQHNKKLCKYYRGQLDEQQLLNVLQQTRIVFNPAFSSDGQKQSAQTKLRHFEVAGSGAVQLTNYNKELSALFKSNHEILVFENDKEIEPILSALLSDDLRLKQIGRNAYDCAHKKHLMSQRIDYLVKQSFGKKIDFLNSSRKKVALLGIDDINEMFVTGYLDNYKEYDYLHIIPKAVEVDIDYAFLAPQLDLNPELLTFRLNCICNNPKRDWVQPRREEIYSQLLEGFSSSSMLTQPIILQNKVRELFSYPELPDKVNLAGLLIKTKNAKEIIQAIITDGFYSKKMVSKAICGSIYLNENYYRKELGNQPKYINSLVEALTYASTYNASVAIYGLRGDMSETVMAHLCKCTTVNIWGLIDNGLKGQFFLDWQVRGQEALELLDKPDLLFISAAISGPSIYQAINHLQDSIKIMPLYDLSNPIWETMKVKI
ncbi:glycosyltransferase [Psychromonas sp. SA13A]|uniref:glycosyltransferase family protein n=1 Tax=Psychromonas sp. SA13A TaxID=2686346 RepID=UPI00140948C6|nr:glycosyltransferase [Psychromonas sp. SA13A]